MWSALLDQVVSIERQTPATDSAGGTTRTFAVALSNIPAAIQPASSRIVESFARRSISVDTMIYTTTDLNALLAGGLKAGDRIVDANSTKYVVQGVKKQLNQVLSTEPLYEIAALQQIV